MSKDMDEVRKGVAKSRTSGEKLVREGMATIDEMPEEDRKAMFDSMVENVIKPSMAVVSEREYLVKNDAQRKAEAMEPLYRKLDRVIERLFDIAMNGKKESDQLKAIITIMDRTIGKPVEQNVESLRENQKQVIDVESLEENQEAYRKLLDAAKRQGYNGN